MLSDGTVRSASEISELTGIPQGARSGKVTAHLAYMQVMGLLEEDKATLTQLGQCIKSEDPACSELLTQWLLHANLTSVRGADMWHYVYRELLPSNGGNVSIPYYKQSVADHYGIRKEHAVVRTCYTNGMAEINYLKEENDGLSVCRQKIQREYTYLYAYDILREWEALYGDVREITAEQFESMQCAACFGLNATDWFTVLETLCTKGLFQLNRQLTPYTVIRNTDATSIIDKLYSLLI